MQLVAFLVAALVIALTGSPTVAQVGAPPNAVTPNPLIQIPVKPHPFRTAAPVPARVPFAPGAAPPTPTCSGADPALTPAQVLFTSKIGGLTKYSIGSSVVNRGALAQLPNVQQRVEFYVDGTRTQVQTVPPLQPEGVYHFAFAYSRSIEAGAGTTTIEIRYRDLVKADRPRDDCNPNNDKVFIKI